MSGELCAPELDFLGDSEASRRMRARVRSAAASDASLLIRGERGSGKRFVASAVHRLSARTEAALVAVDCSSLGAAALGSIELADGGTLLLVEIGDLRAPLQRELLDLVDAGTLRQPGDLRERWVDVRVIATTARDLEAMIAAGRFLRDLHDRLDALSIDVPPLRERREDIPLLAREFLRAETASARRSIRPSALERLCRHSWPGNVRELRAVMELAGVIASGVEITEADLPSYRTSDFGAPSFGSEGAVPSLKDLERRYIQTLLERFSGHRARVAEALGISERNLYRKLRAYSLG